MLFAINSGGTTRAGSHRSEDAASEMVSRWIGVLVAVIVVIVAHVLNEEGAFELKRTPPRHRAIRKL